MNLDLLPTDWSLPDRLTHQGIHVSLSPLDPMLDIAELYELSHNPPEYQQLWNYLPYGPFPSQEIMLEWLVSMAELADPIFFTITSLALHRRVGLISILNISAANGRAELGHIWVSPLVQRRGIVTEATLLLLTYLFDQLHYRRVEWKCNDQNLPSKSTAQRIGFIYEGLFRQHMVVKGNNRDTAWFSLLDHEWPAQKAKFVGYFREPGIFIP